MMAQQYSLLLKKGGPYNFSIANDQEALEHIKGILGIKGNLTPETFKTAGGTALYKECEPKKPLVSGVEIFPEKEEIRTYVLVATYEHKSCVFGDRVINHIITGFEAVSDKVALEVVREEYGKDAASVRMQCALWMTADMISSFLNGNSFIAFALKKRNEKYYAVLEKLESVSGYNFVIELNVRDMDKKQDE
jgi:hypothetical protein